jgi:hypothetical protein
MKWSSHITPEPLLGETRQVTKFLWFPKEMAGTWRWLETATWEQVYVLKPMSDWLYLGWWDNYEKGWVK